MCLFMGKSSLQWYDVLCVNFETCTLKAYVPHGGREHFISLKTLLSSHFPLFLE